MTAADKDVGLGLGGGDVGMHVHLQSMLWFAPEITNLTESWSSRKHRNPQVYELCCTLQNLILGFSSYVGCSNSPYMLERTVLGGTGTELILLICKGSDILSLYCQDI